MVALIDDEKCWSIFLIHIGWMAKKSKMPSTNISIAIWYASTIELVVEPFVLRWPSNYIRIHSLQLSNQNRQNKIVLFDYSTNFELCQIWIYTPEMALELSHFSTVFAYLISSPSRQPISASAYANNGRMRWTLCHRQNTNKRPCQAFHTYSRVSIAADADWIKKNHINISAIRSTGLKNAFHKTIKPFDLLLHGVKNCILYEAGASSFAFWYLAGRK